jgi:hypothetical protein
MYLVREPSLLCRRYEVSNGPHDPISVAEDEVPAGFVRQELGVDTQRV